MPQANAPLIVDSALMYVYSAFLGILIKNQKVKHHDKQPKSTKRL